MWPTGSTRPQPPSEDMTTTSAKTHATPCQPNQPQGCGIHQIQCSSFRAKTKVAWYTYTRHVLRIGTARMCKHSPWLKPPAHTSLRNQHAGNSPDAKTKGARRAAQHQCHNPASHCSAQLRLTRPLCLVTKSVSQLPPWSRRTQSRPALLPATA